MEILELSHERVYFVTICAKDMAWVFGDIVGRDHPIPPTVELSECGVVINELIQNIPNKYDNVRVSHYVIMPNHIHMLIHIGISIHDSGVGVSLQGGMGSSGNDISGGMGSSRPTLQNVIRAIKSLTTKAMGFSPWQDSFHDHIIRSEKDYRYHVQYIASNPEKWRDDAYCLDK